MFSMALHLYIIYAFFYTFIHHPIFYNVLFYTRDYFISFYYKKKYKIKKQIKFKNFATIFYRIEVTLKQDYLLKMEVLLT